ncbi:hypothetical protein ACMYYO_12830 [Dermacoccaceae bacterium W4C1]
MSTPLGSFADVMVQTADGQRTLLAPNDAVAELLTGTYTFDDVIITPVQASAPADADGVVVAEGSWKVRSQVLDLDLQVRGRHPLGALLGCVPYTWASAPLFCRAIDPIARVLVPGVRTAGTAGGGRREYYGALDCHRIVAARGRLAKQELHGPLPVEPPVGFGFGSTLRSPTCTKVVTTIVG